MAVGPEMSWPQIDVTTVMIEFLLAVFGTVKTTKAVSANGRTAFYSNSLFRRKLKSTGISVSVKGEDFCQQLLTNLRFRIADRTHEIPIIFTAETDN